MKGTLDWEVKHTETKGVRFLRSPIFKRKNVRVTFLSRGLAVPVVSEFVFVLVFSPLNIFSVPSLSFFFPTFVFAPFRLFFRFQESQTTGKNETPRPYKHGFDPVTDGIRASPIRECDPCKRRAVELRGGLRNSKYCQGSRTETNRQTTVQGANNGLFKPTEECNSPEVESQQTGV